MNGPQQQRMHSPHEQSNVKANIGAKSVTNERVTGDDLVEERRPNQEEVWGKLVGRANEGKNLCKWATSDCSVRHWEPGNTC